VHRCVRHRSEPTPERLAGRCHVGDGRGSRRDLPGDGALIGNTASDGSNPTPYGYTWSLLLFVVPIVVIGFWFLPCRRRGNSATSFLADDWRSRSPRFRVGFLLRPTVLSFRQPRGDCGDRSASLGRAGSSRGVHFLLHRLPLCLLIYVWLDEFWLVAYNLPDHPDEATKISRLLQFHPTSAIVGVLLILLAVVYKKMFSPVPVGFPGYFTVRVAGTFVPAMSFFPTARPCINWRAFSLTVFIIVRLSLLWEATLAVPYKWWSFQDAQMTGLFIGARPACRSRRSGSGSRSPMRL
jgi:hypothetical protein